MNCPGSREYPRRVFGLTFEKLLLIGVIAILIIGPDRLPAAAASFARFIRGLRDMADNAKGRMRDELGPEYDDIDWKKLDPRQYDPRRIIREALLDEPATPVRPVSAPMKSDAAPTARPVAKPVAKPVVKPTRDVNASTPFDGEST